MGLLEKVIFSDAVDSIGGFIDEKASDVTASVFNKANRATGGKVAKATKPMFNVLDDDLLDDMLDDGEKSLQDDTDVKPNGVKAKKAKKSQTKSAEPAYIFLAKEVRRLNDKEERRIESIRQEGKNFAATLVDLFIKRDKHVGLHDFSRKITGKSMEEKIEDARSEFERKRMNLYKRISLPEDVKELWELFVLVHSLVENEQGAIAKETVRDLYSKLFERGKTIFPGDDSYAERFSSYG